jgi:predicted AAA+ superfamily ATPase
MVGMKRRYLEDVINEFCFTDHKMALVSGPRQCGKTTFAKMLLKDRKSGAYFNWDNLAFRRLWTKEPLGIIPHDTTQIPLIVLDEIHKDRRWKRNLKGVYDTIDKPCDILVTGSARLNVYKKGSDSLLGRYFHFRLHPFSLSELSGHAPNLPDTLIPCLFDRSKRTQSIWRKTLEDFLNYGPFPEPLLNQNIKKVRAWRRQRHDLIIREDLRDISRIPELARIEMLASLLPERVGSPFSVSSLVEYLEVSHVTIRKWIEYLKELYFLFEVKPWQKRIPRSLKKEGKIYLWDYGEVDNPAARFENLVACHLLKACDYWNDSGEGDFRLNYLRNKEKQEIDFLIVRDGRPWLPVEVKLSDTQPSQNWSNFLPPTGCKFALQIVNKPYWKIHEYEDVKILVADAAEALQYFI